MHANAVLRLHTLRRRLAVSVLLWTCSQVRGGWPIEPGEQTSEQTDDYPCSRLHGNRKQELCFLRRRETRFDSSSFGCGIPQVFGTSARYRNTLYFWSFALYFSPIYATRTPIYPAYAPEASTTNQPQFLLAPPAESGASTPGSRRACS
jgi:hypothetical protein